MITNIVTGQQVSGVDSAEIFFSEVRRLVSPFWEPELGDGSQAIELFQVFRPPHVYGPSSKLNSTAHLPVLETLLQIPEDVVTKLCSEGTVLHCAGGLMVEHVLIQPYITKINGSIDSVMGLSKTLVDKLLEQIQQPS